MRISDWSSDVCSSDLARARADYQNLERRSQEQRFEVGRVALIDAVRGFLPILDDLLRAVEHAEADADDAAWVEGIRLVAQKFETAFASHGVEERSEEHTSELQPLMCI